MCPAEHVQMTQTDESTLPAFFCHVVAPIAVAIEEVGLQVTSTCTGAMSHIEVDTDGSQMTTFLPAIW